MCERGRGKQFRIYVASGSASVSGSSSDCCVICLGSYGIAGNFRKSLVMHSVVGCLRPGLRRGRPCRVLVVEILLALSVCPYYETRK